MRIFLPRSQLQATAAASAALAVAFVFVFVFQIPAQAQTSVNAGEIAANSAPAPFNVQSVATFDTPWAMAFLPDGRMLVTEKPGKLFVVSPDGKKQELSGVPEVYYRGQNGLLDVAVSPKFADDKSIYLTYVAPSDNGGSLVLAKAELSGTGNQTRMTNLKTVWRQAYSNSGGQPGGIVAFSPDAEFLFLTAGDRMRPETAQDPEQAAGKVIRLRLDGSVPADNPMASQGGVRAQTWSMGHRNPYGLAFAPDGKLWLHEMGPRGGDELNLIERSKNYGWPIVSNGDNYSGIPIPRHRTRPEFQAPALYWTPIVAPAGLVFYTGDMFPQWKGSALIGGLASTALIRVAIAANGDAKQVDRWDLKRRIRDVAVAKDGAVWLIEDSPRGQLMRLTPAS